MPTSPLKLQGLFAVCQSRWIFPVLCWCCAAIDHLIGTFHQLSLGTGTPRPWDGPQHHFGGPIVIWQNPGTVYFFTFERCCWYCSGSVRSRVRVQSNYHAVCRRQSSRHRFFPRYGWHFCFCLLYLLRVFHLDGEDNSNPDRSDDHSDNATGLPIEYFTSFNMTSENVAVWARNIAAVPHLWFFICAHWDRSLPHIFSTTMLDVSDQSTPSLPGYLMLSRLPNKRTLNRPVLKSWDKFAEFRNPFFKQSIGVMPPRWGRNITLPTRN